MHGDVEVKALPLIAAVLPRPEVGRRPGRLDEVRPEPFQQASAEAGDDTTIVGRTDAAQGMRVLQDDGDLIVEGPPDCSREGYGVDAAREVAEGQHPLPVGLGPLRQALEGAALDDGRRRWKGCGKRRITLTLTMTTIMPETGEKRRYRRTPIRSARGGISSFYYTAPGIRCRRDCAWFPQLGHF
jgi:hypothetical protein